jgi:hypothetical protein
VPSSIAPGDAQAGVYAQVDAALGLRNSSRAELEQFKGQVKRGFIGFQQKPPQVNVSARKLTD